ncbi:MAG: hypothetical protein U0637_01045 [Phycisphaerales bacterium]
MLHRALPVALLLAATPCLADELYRQDPVVNGIGGLAAQDARNPGGLGWFAEVVDNFPGQAGWSIGSVEFWGGYVTDVPGNTHGFMIRFYDGETGTVGPLLLTQDVMTFTETEYYSTVITGIGTVRGYHYTVNLSTPFVVPADGQYWISVTAILDRGGGANEPQWGWAGAASTTAPSCMQWFFSPGNFTSQGHDVGFALNSAPSGPVCDSIDFNHDDLFPDTQDIVDFISVFGGGACPTGACGDIDFNNDGLFPDTADIQSLLNVFAGGACT